MNLIFCLLLVAVVLSKKHGGRDGGEDNNNNGNKTSSIGVVFLKCKNTTPFIIGNRATCVEICKDGTAPIVINNRPVCPIASCATGLDAIIDETANVIVACLKPCAAGSFRSKFNNNRCIKYCSDGSTPPFDDVKQKFLRCPISCVGKIQVADNDGVTVACVTPKPCTGATNVTWIDKNGNSHCKSRNSTCPVSSIELASSAKVTCATPCADNKKRMVDERNGKSKCVDVCPVGTVDESNGCTIPIDRRVIDIGTGADANKNGIPDCCETWLDNAEQEAHDAEEEEADRKRSKGGKKGSKKGGSDDEDDTEDDDTSGDDTEDDNKGKKGGKKGKKGGDDDTEDDDTEDDGKGKSGKGKKGKKGGKKGGNDTVVVVVAKRDINFSFGGGRGRLCPSTVSCPPKTCAVDETAVQRKNGLVRCVKNCCADSSCPVASDCRDDSEKRIDKRACCRRTSSLCGALCSNSEICVPDPKQCFTTPCPQFKCVPFDASVCTDVVCPCASSTEIAIDGKCVNTAQCKQCGGTIECASTVPCVKTN